MCSVSIKVDQELTTNLANLTHKCHTLRQVCVIFMKNNDIQAHLFQLFKPLRVKMLLQERLKCLQLSALISTHSSLFLFFFFFSFRAGKSHHRIECWRNWDKCWALCFNRWEFYRQLRIAALLKVGSVHAHGWFHMKYIKKPKHKSCCGQCKILLASCPNSFAKWPALRHLTNMKESLSSLKLDFIMVFHCVLQFHKATGTYIRRLNHWEDGQFAIKAVRQAH